MKCSHKKALDYYSEMRPKVSKDNMLQIRCNRCKKYVGDKEWGYPLPKDFKKLAGLTTIEIMNKNRFERYYHKPNQK